MEQKNYRTYDDIISTLNSRGLSTDDKTKGILEKENYYNVINGYKSLFLQEHTTATSDEKYKINVTFNEIYALYNFDREVRIIYLKYILRIENNFKTVIANVFSKNYGHDNYLKLENFNCSSSNNINILRKIANLNNLNFNTERDKINTLSISANISNVVKLIGDIQQEISRQLNKNNVMVSHYLVNYGYIPLWVLVNVLTFGKLTYFYLNLKDDDKKTISKQFKIDYIELHKYMDMLSFARNKCAHDERFYNIQFKKALHTNSIKKFSVLSLPKNKSNEYIKGIKDAYALAIIFKHLLTDIDFKEFTCSMENSINTLSKQIKSIHINDILNIMGYTPTWKNISEL